MRMWVQLPIQIKIKYALKRVSMSVKEILIVSGIPIVLDLRGPQQGGGVLFQVAPVYDKRSSGHVDGYKVLLDGALGARLVEFLGE